MRLLQKSTPPKSTPTGTSLRRPAGGLQEIQCLTSPPAGDLGGESGLLQLPHMLFIACFRTIPYDTGC